MKLLCFIVVLFIIFIENNHKKNQKNIFKEKDFSINLFLMNSY